MDVTDELGTVPCCGLPLAGGPDWTIAGSAKGGTTGPSHTEISFMSVPRKIIYWKTSSLGPMTLSARRPSVPNDLTISKKNYWHLCFKNLIE